MRRSERGDAGVPGRRTCRQGRRGGCGGRGGWLLKWLHEYQQHTRFSAVQSLGFQPCRASGVQAAALGISTNEWHAPQTSTHLAGAASRAAALNLFRLHILGSHYVFGLHQGVQIAAGCRVRGVPSTLLECAWSKLNLRPSPHTTLLTAAASAAGGGSDMPLWRARPVRIQGCCHSCSAVGLQGLCSGRPALLGAARGGEVAWALIR